MPTRREVLLGIVGAAVAAGAAGCRQVPEPVEPTPAPITPFSGDVFGEVTVSGFVGSSVGDGPFIYRPTFVDIRLDGDPRPGSFAVIEGRPIGVVVGRDRVQTTGIAKVKVRR